jgi:hypothetical protein
MEKEKKKSYDVPSRETGAGSLILRRSFLCARRRKKPARLVPVATRIPKPAAKQPQPNHPRIHTCEFACTISPTSISHPSASASLTSSLTPQQQQQQQQPRTAPQPRLPRPQPPPGPAPGPGPSPATRAPYQRVGTRPRRAHRRKGGRMGYGWAWRSRWGRGRRGLACGTGDEARRGRRVGAGLRAGGAAWRGRVRARVPVASRSRSVRGFGARGRGRLRFGPECVRMGSRVGAGWGRVVSCRRTVVRVGLTGWPWMDLAGGWGNGGEGSRALGLGGGGQHIKGGGRARGWLLAPGVVEKVRAGFAHTVRTILLYKERRTAGRVDRGRSCVYPPLSVRLCVGI